MPKTKQQYPIFEEYSISALAERLPYGEAYLVDIKRGHQPLRRRFILTACGILNRNRAELFGDAA
jgi:hypothetical protein